MKSFKQQFRKVLVLQDMCLTITRQYLRNLPPPPPPSNRAITCCITGKGVNRGGGHNYNTSSLFSHATITIIQIWKFQIFGMPPPPPHFQFSAATLEVPAEYIFSGNIKVLDWVAKKLQSVDNNVEEHLMKYLK